MIIVYNIFFPLDIAELLTRRYWIHCGRRKLKVQ